MANAQTHLEQALGLKYPPLAIFYADEPPLGAKLGSPMCSMLLIAQAAKGETAVLSRKSCRCHGAAAGFGLDELYPEAFPGGAECFYRFLSMGNEDWEPGRAVLRQMKEAGAPKILLEEFAEGERFYAAPELVEEWARGLPKVKPEGGCIVIKPLARLLPGEKPKAVAFLVNPDQLSALTVLANFNGGVDNVRLPFGAGCICFGLLPFAEAAREKPRAVVGLTDISARFYLRKPLGRDILSFTVPFAMFEQMEADAPKSFLHCFAWRSMRQNGA